MSLGLSSSKLTALKNDKDKVRSAKSYCGKAESNSVYTDTKRDNAKGVVNDAVYTQNSDGLKQRVDNWNKGVTEGLEYAKGIMEELISHIEEQIEEEKWRLKREREAERKAKETSSQRE